jgi:uncharacterized membrane-anchored protein YitT (DUF2179 family)
VTTIAPVGSWGKLQRRTCGRRSPVCGCREIEAYAFFGHRGREQMYFWNAEKLAEDFREGRVDERERFKYYFGYMIVLAVGHLLPRSDVLSYDMETLIFGVVFLIIAALGILLCYKANSSRDNRDFIARMICLTWPISIRLSVFIFLTSLLCMGFYTAFLAMGGVMDSPLAKAATRPEFMAPVLESFLTIFWYWMMYKYLTRIAHHEPA